MIARGRPLRFLAIVTVSWIGVRVAMLWPTSDSFSEAIERAVALPEIVDTRASDALPTVVRPPVEPRAPKASSSPRMLAALPPARMPSIPGPATVAEPAPEARVRLAMLGFLRYGSAVPIEANAAVPQLLAPPPPATQARPLDPWRFSFWLFSRSGAATPGLARLGGGQAGVRASYRVIGPLSASARLATALDGSGREVALGGEVRLGKLPVTLTADYRVALDGGRSGPALGVVAGVDDMTVAGRASIEAYGQAGVVFRDRPQGYADGAARITVPVAPRAPVRITVGAGTWAGVQPGAARVDVGPSAVARVPVGDRDFRIALDWRQRIAGRAAPGSGLALTVGADF